MKKKKKIKNYIYIYIYREREREKGKQRSLEMNTLIIKLEIDKYTIKNIKIKACA